MIDYEVMVKRAAEDCDEHLARIAVKTMVDNWVPELEQNLLEWIEHKPFSDVKIGIMTLNVVLNLWGGQCTIIDLARAVKEFRDYIDRGYTYPEIFGKWFVYG